MATPIISNNLFAFQLRGPEEPPSVAGRPPTNSELSRKRRRGNGRLAALPLDSETLLQAATVASVSSLATSLWMRRRPGSDSPAQQRDDDRGADGAETVEPQQASNAEDIWNMTWSAFSGGEGGGEGEPIESPLLYIQVGSAPIF
jgi:hypothetical protein